EINEIGLAFLGELEALSGIRPMLYTDAYAADSLWYGSLGAYPLWAADWGPEEPDITSGVWDGWTGFQYSDDGSLPGIRGRVDLDRFTAGVLLDEGEGEPEPCENERRYTVRPGDTLWAIARRFGTTVAELARLNGIRDPALIYPGEVLRIPGT
ncbi:MAG: LysM peptidoglycan-binding domain-containing protein, partial [Clostridia bacterium]|nr:LysM peptidoglycan-binding domain-containing protein [Clostridia bacterium]